MMLRIKSGLATCKATALAYYCSGSHSLSQLGMIPESRARNERSLHQWMYVPPPKKELL